MASSLYFCNHYSELAPAIAAACDLLYRATRAPVIYVDVGSQAGLRLNEGALAGEAGRLNTGPAARLDSGDRRQHSSSSAQCLSKSSSTHTSVGFFRGGSLRRSATNAFISLKCTLFFAPLKTFGFIFSNVNFCFAQTTWLSLNYYIETYPQRLKCRSRFCFSSSTLSESSISDGRPM